MNDVILIRPLRSDHDAEAFNRLNRRWITEYFALTPEDEVVLGRPREAIIAPCGGCGGVDWLTERTIGRSCTKPRTYTR